MALTSLGSVPPILNGAIIVVQPLGGRAVARPVGLVKMQCWGILQLFTRQADPIDVHPEIVGKLFPWDGMDPRADAEKTAEG